MENKDILVIISFQNLFHFFTDCFIVSITEIGSLFSEYFSDFKIIIFYFIKKKMRFALLFACCQAQLLGEDIYSHMQDKRSLQVGCLRESFLVVLTGTVEDRFQFLQAVIEHYISKCQAQQDHQIFTWKSTEKFLKWRFRKFKIFYAGSKFALKLPQI